MAYHGTETERIEKAAAHEVEDRLGADALFQAKHASDEEHNETIFQAFKNNRKAVGWSIAISLSVVMEGYDTILMGNFFGFPEFQKKYGQDYGGDVGYLVSAPWQTGLNMASTCGAIIGALINGYVAGKIGYRWVMIYGLAIMNVFIFVIFFASNAGVLVAGQVLVGLTWGVFATVGPAYASEVCPTNLRGYMTTYVNLCWAIGQFIAAGVLRACLERTDEWAFRIPFAIQWVWPLPIMILCWFAPESPYFLIRKDRIEEARVSIRRLGGNKTDEQINATLAMIFHTNKIENDLHEGTSYWDCFKGTDLRRTEIVCLTFMGQILSGSSFAYSPTFFFTTAGMSTDKAYDMNLGSTAIAFSGTCLSWLVLTYLGRRKIYLVGMSLLCVVQLLIAILDAATSSSGGLWAQAALCIVWSFTYSVTIGPIAYCIVSETSSVRLRPLSVVLARNAYQLVNIVSQILQSYFMNPTAWNTSGKTGFFWAGTAAMILTWAFFRLPECKGRTYEELDILFANKIKARDFKKTHVDAYAGAGQDSHEIHEATMKE